MCLFYLGHLCLDLVWQRPATTQHEPNTPATLQPADCRSPEEGDALCGVEFLAASLTSLALESRSSPNLLSCLALARAASYPYHPSSRVEAASDSSPSSPLVRSSQTLQTSSGLVASGRRGGARAWWKVPYLWTGNPAAAGLPTSAFPPIPTGGAAFEQQTNTNEYQHTDAVYIIYHNIK